MKRLMLVDPEDQSQYITIKDLLDYKREGSSYYATEKDLLEGDASINLDGMGFNTSYDADGDIQIIDPPINKLSAFSDGGTTLYTYYDLMGNKARGNKNTGAIWKVSNYQKRILHWKSCNQPIYIWQGKPERPCCCFWR